MGIDPKRNDKEDITKAPQDFSEISSPVTAPSLLSFLLLLPPPFSSSFLGVPPPIALAGYCFRVNM